MSEETKNVSEEQKTEARRDFIKKTAYIAPVIMTMPAIASAAASGSGYTGTNGGGTVRVCPTGYELDASGACVLAPE